jgi:hypothetical protein
MSADSLHVAGVVLITVPAIALVAGPILMPLDFVLSVCVAASREPQSRHLPRAARAPGAERRLSDLALGLLSA